MAESANKQEKRSAPPNITLLMLVTNYDCLIAHRCINSYRKLWKIRSDFVLKIVANCLSQKNKRAYFNRWRRLPFVQLVDNEEQRPLSIEKGQFFKTPEGIEMPYEGDCEHQEQIWFREHRFCDSPFFGTVDADFEIISPRFFIEMMDRLDADPQLVACATHAIGDRENYFDTYSNRTILLRGRLHTWCCVYKSVVRQHLDEVSPHYFERKLDNGVIEVFDSYAHFQSHLRSIGNYKLKTISRELHDDAIHYGAFSKNRSINKLSLTPFRLLSKLSHRGLFGQYATITRRSNSMRRINNLVRDYSVKAHKFCFTRAESERQKNHT